MKKPQNFLFQGLVDYAEYGRTILRFWAELQIDCSTIAESLAFIALYRRKLRLAYSCLNALRRGEQYPYGRTYLQS